MRIKKIGEFEAQIAGIGGVGKTGLEANNSGADHFLYFTIEILHAVGAAIAHGVEQRLAFGLALFHILARAQRGFQNFNGGDAAFAIGAGEQALRKDVTEGPGEAVANTVLIFHGENADDALDSFGGVNGMQGGENKVAGFGSFQGDFDSLAVAHLADKDDLGRLAKGAAKGGGKGRCVAVKFALVNGGLFVAMKELDGILDGEDVDGLFRIHPVNDGSEGGGFAGAGGTGDKNNAGVQRANLVQLRGKMQLLERRDLVRDDAHDDGAASALPEDVDAKPRGIFQPIGNIRGAFFFELSNGVLIVAEEHLGDLLRIVRHKAFEAFEFQFDKLAADFDLGGAAGGEDEIADMVAGAEHGQDELRNLEGALDRWQGRRCGHDSPGTWNFRAAAGWHKGLTGRRFG